MEVIQGMRDLEPNEEWVVLDRHNAVIFRGPDYSEARDFWRYTKAAFRLFATRKRPPEEPAMPEYDEYDQS